MKKTEAGHAAWSQYAGYWLQEIVWLWLPDRSEKEETVRSQWHQLLIWKYCSNTELLHRMGDLRNSRYWQCRPSSGMSHHVVSRSLLTFQRNILPLSPLSHTHGGPTMVVIYMVSTFARKTKIPYFVGTASQHCRANWKKFFHDDILSVSPKMVDDGCQ
jgi:hypothetical protein